MLDLSSSGIRGIVLTFLTAESASDVQGHAVGF